jgi:hypothetical protein
MKITGKSVSHQRSKASKRYKTDQMTLLDRFYKNPFGNIPEAEKLEDLVQQCEDLKKESKMEYVKQRCDLQLLLEEDAMKKFN